MCISKNHSPLHDYLGNVLHDLSNIGLDNGSDHCDYITLEDISDVPCDKGSFKAVQLNIRGLISKSTSLSLLLSECLSTEKIDIVMLCETWLTPSVKSLLNIPVYQYHDLERMNRKGGGVGLLIANELKFRSKPELDCMTTDFECCFVKLSTKSGNMICGSF